MQKALVETWDALMDNRINPLRRADWKMVRGLVLG
jgi:hypothetical protein